MPAITADHVNYMKLTVLIFEKGPKVLIKFLGLVLMQLQMTLEDFLTTILQRKGCLHFATTPRIQKLSS